MAGWNRTLVPVDAFAAVSFAPAPAQEGVRRDTSFHGACHDIGPGQPSGNGNGGERKVETCGSAPWSGLDDPKAKVRHGRASWGGPVAPAPSLRLDPSDTALNPAGSERPRTVITEDEMTRLSPFARIAFFASIFALAIPGTVDAKPRTASASAQPVDAGKEIQFHVNVTDASHDIAWYRVWLQGQPEPSGRINVSSYNPGSLRFGNPGQGGAGGSVSIKFVAPAQSTRIHFRVRCVNNEELVDSFPVTVRAPATPAVAATKITSARYNAGTIEVTLDGAAGPGAKIEADIWPIGSPGVRCIDQPLPPTSTRFAKNVSGFLKVPGRYQSRVHLIRNGQLVHFVDLHGINK